MISPTVSSATGAGSASRVVQTACRICAVGCGVLVDIDGTTVTRVTGDPEDPVTKGYTCSKGRAGPEFHHASDRLYTPLVRRHGRLVETGWDEALDDIAARTAALVAEHGSGSIANYVGTGGPLDPAGYAMAHGFFRSLGSSQNYSALSVDCSGKYLVPQLVSGVQMMFQPDLERTTLLLAIGVNTVVSHGHGLMMANPLVHLRNLRERGAKLIVVDPRVSETARHSDLHVALRPGTDPALLAFLVRSVLLERPDRAYLDACVDRESIQRLRTVVEPFTSGLTSEICTVPVGTLDQLRAAVLDAGRLGIETGTGTTMNRSANVTEWLVWALSAVTGSLDRAGGSTFNPGFLRPLEEALPAGRGDLGPRPRSRPDLPRIVNGEMPCAALADEIEAGEVKALFVRVGNPAMTFPDNERLRRALRLLDLLVVIDVHPTETTRLASHVLPMTDHFERADLLTGYLQARPFMRFAPATVAPSGQRRQQWWMFAELSRRLAMPLFGSARRQAELDALTTAQPLDDEIIARSMLSHARHSWEEVRASPYGMAVDPLPPGWMIPGRLPQLLDLAPTELVEQFTGFPHRFLPASDQLVMINRRTAESYNSFAIRSVHPALWIHPEDARARGLVDGDTARIATATGSCSAVVQLTERIRAGVVSLPHSMASADVNQLTSSTDIDHLNGMPILSGFPVTVSPSVDR